ncbi:5'-methylthioadenosine/S-adenosylhomocysteine nucleosidase [Brachybacterium sp. JHP9]|uniref:adenosylhomocysteine nucleosidase n=1 Tax=Brachybacterium equifaecis TaxID=2910770 RepID=A0ABT0QY28_9MICO|nr:5'-methylthioadenosine/S-adenosylhomocysteine nucleosidase [Brachybacterium equifaecis]MCL6422580.1 5'-methylthioadenosine/S-adenosylhomocysteine nucleosidase [Brachybacterium equifaecis]
MTSEPLAPAQPAPVLVLAAMAEESSPLVARLTEVQEVAVPFTGSQRAWRGSLAGVDTVVMTTGIGIAAAAAAATWAILTLAPRAVISAGSAGGLAADVEVGTLIIGAQFSYSLADATAFGYAPGQVPGGPVQFEADADLRERAEAAARAAVGTHPVRTGLMLSGDAFVTAPLADPMRERFPGALSADMETTGIAQACAALGTPFVAVRAVSDLCGPAADQQFHLELDLVAELSARAVSELVLTL